MSKSSLPKQPWKHATGHRPHISGSGIHGDKRTKRNRDRSSQKRHAISAGW